MCALGSKGVTIVSRTTWQQILYKMHKPQKLKAKPLSEKQIELCRATAAEAKLMKVKKGAPLLYIKSVAYTYDKEPLYAGAQVFNGEVCSLYVCESVEQ